MMQVIINACQDAVLDTIKLLPFLFLACLLIEFLEHKAQEATVALVHKAGKWGPAIGSLLGVIPQCGFSAATSDLYANGLITRGTMIAVFLSTSDEMIPIFISEQVDVLLILKILAFKIIAALIAGFAVDGVMRLLKKPDSLTPLRGHDHCEEAEEKGILFASITHTLTIAGFILVVSLILDVIVGVIGLNSLSGLVFNKPIIGELLAGLIGLIPNCAASVVITQLYLDGGMSAGAMMSGLLTGAGVGLLVLFRTNHNLKDNLVTVGLLYAWGVAFGLIAEFIGYLAI